LGESITLEFFRNQEKKQTRLYAEALKVLNGGAIDRRLIGATFEELPLKLRSERIKGVLLSGLESGSQLARNGLRPGDIITAVNRQGISDLSDFQGAVGSVRGGLYLQFHRNGGDYRTRID
ncbi:MAG: PDZ domain-containing protein, partial [Proteobacteria bacterium]|nr:PDZ domain-containing protein [Pseudomonadota bacterium]